MKRFFRTFGRFLLLALVCAARGAGPYGADNGWAVDDSGQALLTPTVAAQMSQGGTGWLRVEMRLIPGHTNWDGAMLGFYDTAINNARAAGLQVLMLIDGGSWPGSQAEWCANNAEHNPGANGDNSYVEAFATNAVLPLVRHFRDRVQQYELWNEPNCWNSVSNGFYSGCTYIYPSNYGWLLARSWEAVHVTDQIGDVMLCFGGVFGHNLNGISSYTNAGAQYIDDTYSAGTNTGGSFAYISSAYQAYPLDGVGQHLYLNQGGLVSSNSFRQYEDWVRQAYTKYEGAGTPKKTFITEFGWQTTNSGNADGVSAAVQDTNLVTAFSAIRATPYVQMAIWFQWQDNPAGSLWYGVVNSAGGAKTAYADYGRFERFEGNYANGTTNSGIRTYYNGLGHATLGNPFDHGRSAWVYTNLNWYAQDFDGGAHGKLTLMSSTNGTFELNDLHGLWSYYDTNNGPVTFGYVVTNEFTYASGTRQDFSRGFLTWDPTNQILWFPGNVVPPPPTGLTGTPGNAQVTLQWNPAPPATSYYVKRSMTNGGPYTTLTSVVGATTFVDWGLANGTTYFYVVSAVDLLGESGNSVQVSALPVGPPHITGQPQSLTVNQGDRVEFDVTASSLVPMTYQWRFNGGSLPGATNTSLILTNADPGLAGNYTVVVSNYGGPVNSARAVLGVRTYLAINRNGVLSWNGTYILQSATNITGPFGDVPGATSPFTNQSQFLPRQFFRLR